MIIDRLKQAFQDMNPQQLEEYKECILRATSNCCGGEFRGDIFCMPYTNNFKELDSMIPDEIMKKLIPWGLSKLMTKSFEKYLIHFSINKRSEMCDKYLEDYTISFFLENKKRSTGLDVLEIIGLGKDNLSKLTIDDILSRDRCIPFYVVRFKDTEDGRWRNDFHYFLFHDDAERRLMMLMRSHKEDDAERHEYMIIHDYIYGSNHSELFSSKAYQKMAMNE